MSISRALVLAAAVTLSFSANVANAKNPFRWFTSNEEYPTGSRQKCHSGKVWPTDARPSGQCEPYVQQYHAAHYWPDPYRYQDRGVMHGMLEIQTSAGWTDATTLYDQHFDQESHEINGAGRIHLRWIVLHAPARYRMAWVQSGASPQVSEARLASVQQEMTLLGACDTCPAMLRVCLPLSTPAEEVDLIRRAFLATTPQPRIPLTTQGASSGAGNSGTGGSSGTQAGTPSGR